MVVGLSKPAEVSPPAIKDGLKESTTNLVHFTMLNPPPTLFAVLDFLVTFGLSFIFSSFTSSSSTTLQT
jgi:hypothetical protein